MTDRTVRVAVLGAGRMGALHAENLAFRTPFATLALVADSDPGGAAERCARPLGARFTKDVESALTDSGVDAVVISTPTPTHVTFILAAAAQRKHIFCEKPVSTDPGKIDEALAAVREAGVELQIGFNRRFDPSFRKAREHVASGELGSPVLLTLMHCDASLPPLDYLKTSGGIFHDMMIHDFDVARWLVGQEVVEVSAQGTCAIEPAIAELGDVDTAVVTLRFEKGALGVVRGCRHHPTGHDVRAELLLTKGVVEVKNPLQTSVTVGDAKGLRGDRFADSFLARFSDAYVAEMRSFVGALAAGRPVEAPGDSALAALACARAASESFRRQVPVAVGSR